MGGSGSGYRISKKDTVEDCLTLDISFFVKQGILHEFNCRSGSLQWTNSYTGEPTSSIGYEINTLDTGGPWVRLHYVITRPDGEKKAMDYKVLLETTRPHFGGSRWWFICALTVGSKPSWRRVGKLYLPPGGSYFGCRHCYDLTYQSCQESHKFDRMYADLADKFPGMTAKDVERMFSEDL
ncbi:hypothetical protein ACFL2P_01640 [Candidatus Moduliflexota bacterium]